MPNQPNLILISLDTFRADVAYRGDLPNFTTLCQRGTAFHNVVASAPLTPVSHASVFTGLQPFQHGVRHLFQEQLNTPASTIAQLMSTKGYNTGAVVSCPGLHRWYGLNAGFDHYDDEIPLLADGTDPLQTIDVKLRGTALKRAPLVVERSLEWLEQNRHNPFFLFMHFFDTHWPYEAPELFGADSVNAYEQEAYFIDHYLGKFVAQLETWGLLDNTMLVLFGDHGEDLAGWYANDHAGEELGYPEEEGHGCLLFDATQMVPLVFVQPNRDAQAVPVPTNHTITTQVRLVDILPTLTELFGLSDTASRAGQSLVNLFSNPEPHRLAYCETYYREEQSESGRGIAGLNPWKGYRLDNRYKLILDAYTHELAIYDLENDPTEHHPLTTTPEWMNPLVAQLKEIM